MDDAAEELPVRRDSARSDDGHDRRAADDRVAAVEGELLGAGRLLLEQISALRTEIDQLSSLLGEQSATIARTLDELVERAQDLPGRPAADEAPQTPASTTSAGADVLPTAPSGGTEHALVPAPEAARLRGADEAATALADARLVALDMALGGSSGAEIEHALAARFDLSDPGALTAEVLAAIG